MPALARKDQFAIEHDLSLGELLHKLGGISPKRVRISPPPGSATEQDVIAARNSPSRRLCELVHGVLVEKAMGFEESCLEGVIIQLLLNFVRPLRLGFVLGPDGFVKLMPELIRIPDVCFISRNRLPGRKAPREPILQHVPNLAIEVISKGNTRAEMRHKVIDYFAAGVELVWLVYPRTRTVVVHTSPEEFQTLTDKDVLEGGSVLNGFRLSLNELFGAIDE